MGSKESQIVNFIDRHAKELICINPDQESYSQFIKYKLENYLNSLKVLNSKLKISRLDDTISHLNLTINTIIEIIKAYENGDIITANNTFVNDIMFDGNIFTLINKMIKKIPKGLSFYRGRKDASNTNLAKNQMFHIAFNERRKISNFRFSIHGYPCLYLSSCSYLCWEEMNRPHIHELSIARFESNCPDDNVNVISLNPKIFFESSIRTELKTIPKANRIYFLSDLLTKIPLYFIFLNRVKEKESNFKPEYIFPQMFTNFIKNNLFDKDIYGIEYPSTKIIDKSYTFFNYTFFSYPSSDPNCKYCLRLCGNFHLTEGHPLTYSILNQLTTPIFSPTYSKLEIPISPNAFVKYESTIFYKHESFLGSIPTTTLSP